MLCKNTGSTIARFNIDGAPGRTQTLNVPPGAEIEVADGYCTPYLSSARKPMIPIITQLCGAMVPQPGRYAPGFSASSYAKITENAPGSDAAKVEALTKLATEQAEQLAKLTAMVQALAGDKLEAGKVEGVIVSGGTHGKLPEIVEPPGEEVDLGDDDDGDQEDADLNALMRQSKGDLLGIARELGASAEEKMTKRQLAEAILAKQAEPEGE